MKMATQPQTLGENKGKPFQGNLIRDKTQETLGRTSQRGIPLSPSPSRTALRWVGKVATV